ncbi:hypothetical protein FQR65_LT07533 [Abscondita terminalis]|nr:hypothetical protein FQR65_LT07533 [Abscondita terminalis]
MELCGQHETLILSVNTAFALLSRIPARTLVERYGTRNIAIFGTLLYLTGTIGTGFACNFMTLLALYGIIAGLGLGIIQIPFQISLNSYFHVQKSVVIRLSLAFRTLGLALMPFVYTTLTNSYDIQNSMLLVGGVSMQILWLSFLLQPVEWHKKNCNNDDYCLDVQPILVKPTNLIKKLNIFGMVCCAFADISFSTLLPLILFDLDFNRNQVANFMFVMYLVNSFSKFLVLIIGDFTKMSTKTKLLYSCIGIIVARSSLVYFCKPDDYVAVAFLLGIAKASTTVHWLAYLSDNTSGITENLLMVGTGCSILLGGPTLGYLKNATGNYLITNHIFNFLTGVSVLLWIAHSVYARFKRIQQSHIYLST